MGFTLADNRIWFRNYQIVLSDDRSKTNFDKMQLVEVGPRFVLNPVKMFSGSFKGQVLYENPNYVSPNTVRADERRGKIHEEKNAKAPDEFADLWQEHDLSD